MIPRLAAIAVVLCGCTAGVGELPGVAPPITTALATSAPTTSRPPSAPSLSVDDVWELHDALVSCLMMPAACETDSWTNAASPARRELTGVVEQRRRADLAAWAPRRPLRRALTRSLPTDDAWHVELCWVDDLVLYRSSGSLDQPIVIDDNELTLSEVWTVSHDGDVWRLTSRTVVEMVPGAAPWCR